MLPDEGLSSSVDTLNDQLAESSVNTNGNMDWFGYVNEWYAYHPESYYQSWWMRPEPSWSSWIRREGAYGRVVPSGWETGAYPVLQPYYPFATMDMNWIDPWLLQDYHGVWW